MKAQNVVPRDVFEELYEDLGLTKALRHTKKALPGTRYSKHVFLPR